MIWLFCLLLATFNGLLHFKDHLYVYLILSCVHRSSSFLLLSSLHVLSLIFLLRIAIAENDLGIVRWGRL